MGLDITVLAVDWGQLERTPAGEREELLYEAMCPDDAVLAAQPEVGWVFPASPKVPWSGRYEFRDTLGLYKAHFWAAPGGPACCSRAERWIADFDEFAALLRQWAVVVDETARRGWGLLGLPI
ncbi:hypothetical protein CLM62_42220 [Streptomyces sp. SA15]|uniref:hypothetical protein n=1 Tax=Streptomyces sp. SA15 TaxID=934019 RepID=UPI000BAF5DE0|nr:hypothetical protein [Streptomyces sp. SA15]PAZ10076.1 hypothetical protein CLM62_42220 [Streptomyces sp. SA15]